MKLNILKTKNKKMLKEIFWSFMRVENNTFK